MISEKDIIYIDDDLVAVNKPCGLLVHRTEISDENEYFAVQLVRDLLGKRVYNVHRIDRPTSGVLLFALNSEVASVMSNQFKEKIVKKTYVALVRGWFPPMLFLNHPVKSGKGVLLDAETSFSLIDRYELAIPVDPYATSRYSMIEARPLTGRFHQIRQHLAHLRNYIINDRVHGTSAHNRMFAEQLGIFDLFLHARKMEFPHPVSGAPVVIEAGFPKHWDEFLKIAEEFNVLD